MANVSIEYAAGLFDGEGCVASYFHSGRYAQVAAKICMTDPRPLLALADTFGGKVRPIKDTRQPNYKPQFEWIIYSKVALAFFQAIVPFALVKREQIELAIQLLSLIGGRGAPKRNAVTYPNAEQRANLVNQIRTLNMRRFEGVTSSSLM